MTRSLLVAALALAGCATTSDNYRPAPAGANEAQERAFAGCRAQATPILSSSTGLVAVTTYNQAIDDCMRAQGYVKQ